MNENHQLVNEITLYCGLPDGAGEALCSHWSG
jgi:hypothetical protein